MKYLLLCFLLISCGPASKLRRAEKLIKKAELQGATWYVDTVFKEVPVILKEIRVDTLISVRAGDTVVLQKDRLQVKYVRLRGDTVFVDAACLPDTVKIEVPVTVTKVIDAKCNPWWWYLVAGLIGSAIMLFIFLLAKIT